MPFLKTDTRWGYLGICTGLFTPHWFLTSSLHICREPKSLSSFSCPQWWQILIGLLPFYPLDRIIGSLSSEVNIAGSVKNLSHFLKIQMARQSVKVFVLQRTSDREPCHVTTKAPQQKKAPAIRSTRKSSITTSRAMSAKIWRLF